jgi:hypothetical protein
MTAHLVHAWRDSTPEATEADLAALWREVAQPDAPIARAVMSNLVVFRNAWTTTREEPLDPLDDVVARHPSRLIVLEQHLNLGAAPAPAAPLSARVGIVMFGPPHARYGVERIVVRVACAEASLPSIVRRLVRGDLPTTVWWTDDLSRIPPLPALVTMGRQLVYDSRGWRDVRAGVRALGQFHVNPRVDLADLNWRRLAPLLHALKHAPAGRPDDMVPADAHVRIAHRPDEAALAWLLAGSVIATREVAAAGTVPEVVESSTPDAKLTVTFRRESKETTAVLSDHGVVIQGHAAPPLVAAAPREKDADAVAAELCQLSQDRALHDAIGALLRIFQ